MKKKKLPVTPELDREREVQAWFELVRSEIKGVAEGHSILLKGQEEIKSELGGVKQAVIENSKEIKGVKSELGGLKSELEGVKNRLGKVEEKLDSNLANHETRIVRLEEKVGV